MCRRRSFRPIPARRDNIVVRALKRLTRPPNEATLIVRRAIVPFSPQMVLVAQGGQYEGRDWMAALAETQLRYSLLIQTAVDNPYDSPEGFYAGFRHLI
jgi:hypothetical protein